ncbi:MAG: type II 3-dehydroquinate dehydratase [Hydrogenibacillus sp.]|nr:type II 3-dehydroquinate dehydratase [Hydrogenibacillus sp.]
MEVLVIHGPNLQLLGMREPDVYGREKLDAINARLKAVAEAYGVGLECRQSNHEGEIVDWIGRSPERFSGIVINPAAYTHTSVAIRDALAAVRLPAVEVHLSNVHKREPFRAHSYVAPVVWGTISGFGPLGYELALIALIRLLKGKENAKDEGAN